MAETSRHAHSQCPDQQLPGFERLATAMMEQTKKAKGVPTIRELRDICAELGCAWWPVRSADLNYSQDEFIPEIAEWIGATVICRGETGGCARSSEA
jgi:hypothetical protein